MASDDFLLNDPRLEAARWHFAFACKMSRKHDELAARALAQYGDHGPLISGCVRTHFPPNVKDALRDLARLVSRECDKAWGARPKHVRKATIRALGGAVARRDGVGFYGPRP